VVAVDGLSDTSNRGPTLLELPGSLPLADGVVDEVGVGSLVCVGGEEVLVGGDDGVVVVPLPVSAGSCELVGDGEGGGDSWLL
jgi:hypothetical protein